MSIRKTVAMPSLEDWKKIADASLKGRSLDSLDRQREDGLLIKPLYTEADRPGITFPQPATASWIVSAQLEPATDPQALNKAILEELEGGAEMLVLDETQDLELIKSALDDVLLDAVQVAVTGGDWQQAAAVITSAWRSADWDNACHVLPGQVTDDLAAMASWCLHEGAEWPLIKPLTISGHVAHEAGHTDAAELAIMLAETACALRGMEAAGMSPEAAFKRLHLSLAVGADLYGGIAKVRAARFVFGRLFQACGVDPESFPVAIHGVTSARQLTRLDADTNMLRNGTALLAMALGGISGATVLPHNWLTGSTREARRLARNSHHIMASEARLGEVVDPASGSFHIDRLTHDLAMLAWQKFQDIEQAGGVVAAQPMLERWASQAADARQKEVNHGREMLLGVTRHPVRGEHLSAVINTRGGSCRPAAPWESLYATHSGRPRRILCLDLNDGDAAAAAAKWFQLAGIEPTVTRSPDRDAAKETIAAARPEILVLGADDDTMASLRQTIASEFDGAVRVVGPDVFDGDKLHRLHDLLGEAS